VVDSDTGYRWYHPDQVALARLIWLLRSVELPLDQVRAAVAAWLCGDADTVDLILRRQRQLLDRRAPPGCAARYTPSII